MQFFEITLKIRKSKIKKALADFYNRQVLKLKSMAFLHRMRF